MDLRKGRRVRAAEQHRKLELLITALAKSFDLGERPRFAKWRSRLGGGSDLLPMFGLSVREVFENLRRSAALPCNDTSLTLLSLSSACTTTLLVSAPHRGSFPRLHCRVPRKSWRLGLHVITWGWLESHSFSSDRPASYSSIAWCARSAGCAPSAALASATLPSQSLAKTHPWPSSYTCDRPPARP